MEKITILESEAYQEPVSAGTTIFKKGDFGDTMYVIVEGVVEIRDGNRLVDELRDGAIFGEMALIDQGFRSASAIARTDCVLVPVNEDRFLFLTQYTPFFALQIMRILVERVRRQMQR